MTKEQLDEALWKVNGIIPAIVVGPGHLIFTFDGYNDPKPGHYRGVRVVVEPGWQERCEVVDLLTL